MEPEVDWLDLCRRVAARQADLFAATRSIAERTVYEGRGEGGDMTLELDRRCEDIVFEELEGLAATDGHSFLAISEERGQVEIGDGEAELSVIIDPIDGSMNVRRTLPSHSLSIAVARGDSMADVEFGYVYDFGAREEFAAVRGGGATLGGDPIAPHLPQEDSGLEVVGLESADPGGSFRSSSPFKTGRIAFARSARSRSRSATSPPAASTRCSRPATAAPSMPRPRS